MSYKVTIHLDFESKPHTNQIVDYVKELGNDLDYELQNNSLGKEKNQTPTHFAVEDITFYGMDEDNEIITNDKGEAVVYQLKAGVRFKPLEYLCEDMTAEQLERIETNQ